MRSRVENIFFLFLLVVIFLFGFLTFTKTETSISKSENRPLATFDHFTIENFVNGTFQNNFESALSDQFILSEDIRVTYAQILNTTPTLGIEDSLCHNRYLEVNNSVDRKRATFNCEDYIVYFPEIPTEEQNNTILTNIQKYNHINTITDSYYYFINDSSVYNFETGQKVIDYEMILKSKLTGNYHISSFDPDTYELYKNYFYKTDHHWNYKGSYQGYLDIVKLLRLNSPLTPTATSSNHEYSFGSHSQNTKNYNIKEEFTFYEFNMPTHNTIVNGSPNTYGNYQNYIEHNYQYDQTTNYYAYFYGPDEGEIIYDFHQPNKDNLLIISNSFSNAINELIASHFNKTYIIDLRRYKTVFNRDFILSDYIMNNNINKTLLILSPTFIREASTNQGLES